MFYGDLQRITLIDGANNKSENLPTYNLDEWENLKKQSPKVKKFIDQIPKTITPASFK
jgi:hypothetical protein